MNEKPELSIVIPTLNERENLKEILSSLALQDGVDIEVILSDGGSAQTIESIEGSSFRISLRIGTAGRAFQLNAGAESARGEFILFLHADSRFNDRLALWKALDALKQAISENNGRLYAGHFAIRFRRTLEGKQLGYRYLESKAKLNRKGCSHGDQGILIPAELFRKHGGFDNSCQILAETRFADRLRENDQWLLLPAEISTSARRFEKEGLKERQTLNALIMTLEATGWGDILAQPGFYPEQEKSEHLNLQPFFKLVGQRVSVLAEKEQSEFWEKVGRYICENAWQAAFWMDIIINNMIDSSGAEKYRLLQMHERYLEQRLAGKSAVRLAAYASRLWLKYMVKWGGEC